MSGRAAGRLAYAVVILGLLQGAAMAYVRVHAADALHGHVSGDAIGAGLVLAAAGVGVLGALIVARAPRNVIGWVFVVTCLLMPLGGLAEVWAGWSAARPDPLPAADLAASFYESGGAVFWAPLFALLLLFPHGRRPPGVWRHLVPLVGCLLALFVLDPLFELELADWLWPAQTMALFLSAASLVARFRSAEGLERQQLRWIATSGGLVLVGVAVTFATVPVSQGAGDQWWMLIGSALTVLGFVSLPVAATIAITRYRLYDLDRLVSRVSTYAVTVAVVIGVYAASVLAVRSIVPGARGSDLAVATSTLLAAAAFSPLLGRVRAAIDRRFDRAHYDAARALADLEARLRDEVEETALVADVRHVLTTTLQPRSVSVWLSR